MLLDRLRIRGRLLALVAVPLALIIGLAVAVAVDRAGRAARASQTAATARQAGDVARMLQELQEERLLALGYLAGRVEPTDLTGQSAVVRDLARVATDVVPADRPGLAATIRGVVSLDGLRARVLERSATPLETYSGYTQVIAGVIGSLRLTDAVDTASPAGRQLAALSAFIEANEANSEGAALLVILAADVEDLTIQRYAASRAVAAEATQRFRGYATQAEIDYLDRIGQAYEARVGTGFATSFAANPRRAVEQLSLDALFPQLDSFDVLGRFTERTILTEVNAEVEAQARRELVAAGSVAAFALLLPLIVVGFGLTVGAGIARPMRRLTRSANRVARAAEAELARVADDEAEAGEPLRLEAVDVASRDEIGELARAFERIQLTAAGLVERQVMSRRNVAQMFGHIGRRTQNMVGRQLDLIDHLEYEETDPARLRELYRLDHLASRLRRSASSLVVLSGMTDTSRYRAPIPLGELVRLALGEIEDYTRVDIDVPGDMLVSPSIIGDLILMLAELMENATRFSPPQTRVRVTARTAPDGFHVSIVDHGLGLSDARIAEENARLARRERLDLAPTEVLGLFVVGRLARRHGATVHLTHTQGGGITAWIAYPRSVLVSDLVGAIAPAAVTVAPTVAPTGAPAAVRAAGAAAGAVRPASPAAVRPGGPAVALARRGPAATRIPEIDVGALERVNEILGRGLTWNAFEPPPVPGPASPGLTSRATEERARREGDAARAPGPARAERAQGSTAAPRPPDAPPALRQRVPGAQLPTATMPAIAVDAPAASDAYAVRDLVEAFEGGVRRAQDHMGRPPLEPPPEPPPGAPLAAPPIPPIPPAPLTRRVPGATVDPLDHRMSTPSGAPQLDPDQALERIRQIEHGVARALDEIHSAKETGETSHDD